MAKKIHFSGIGGVAMAAGARLAADAGWEVRGSDNPLYEPAASMVRALGVPVAEGYAAENLDWEPDAVVIGNALSRGNAEVEAALSRRMRFVSLPEWLKDEVLRARRPVAVCGTHGKTTTTAMCAHVLNACGIDSGYLIGGQPRGFAHPARLGPAGAPFFIEGDEYDTAFFDKRAKFLHYLPEIAVVTSIEFDHGDIYRDIPEIELAFQRMLRQIPREGLALLCVNNAAVGLAPHAFSRVETYGFAEHADWRGVPLESAPGEQRMAVMRGGETWAEFTCPMAGLHNAQNALAAAAVAGSLGADGGAVAEAVASFPGVARRMDVFHEARGAVFVDDFAHHPTAIRETIAAARLRWPGGRLRALFEPRTNTTATNLFQADLAEAFTGVDELWLGPVYRPERFDEGERLDRAFLVASLAQYGIPAHVEEDIPALAERVLAGTQAGDVVLIMSNGAFGGIYDLFRQA